MATVPEERPDFMRLLFAAYCFVSREKGNSLIGVYKRCLRVGLEMAQRGHEVWVFCPNRRQYSDALTEEAENRLHFLDLSSGLAATFSPQARRAWCRMMFRRLQVDMVVAGEVPLAGVMLEPVVWAASSGIRVVVLDNAYAPSLAQQFTEVQGPMFDGVVLTGPSSFQRKDPPPHYCGVPPYLEGDEQEAAAFLNRANPGGHPIITVLAYDSKAEQLAASLLPRLAHHSGLRKAPRAIFLAPDPEGCRRRLEEQGCLPFTVGVLPPPGDNLLFGLLQQSRLAIGKCGFMQITEGLAARTPFLGVHYRGCFPIALIPAAARRFVHAVYPRGSPDEESEAATLEAAVRLLRTPKQRLRRIHDGTTGAVRRVADFLEELPPEPRSTMRECAAMGYTETSLQLALAGLHGDAGLQIDTVRACRLRDLEGCRVDVLVVRYRSGGKRWYEILWGWKYDSTEAGIAAAAAMRSSGREVIYMSGDRRTIIEKAIDDAVLPPLTF